MPSAVAELLAILDLEQLEVNLFRGNSPQVGWQRIFGGQVIGQALVAAYADGGGPQAALPPRLFHPARRPEGADHLRGGAHPRWAELRHAQGQGDPARPRHLRAVSLVPGRRGGAGTPARHALGAPPEDAAQRGRHPLAGDADDAGPRAQLFRARPAHRAAAGRIRALYRRASRASPSSTCGSVRRDRCPTIPPSISACSPTRPT